MKPTELFNNRELSWLEFNRRVLDEALGTGNPLLERVKFLAIAASNLDEFFEVRVAGTMELVEAGLGVGENPDRLQPKDELSLIRSAARELNSGLHRCWQRELVPALAKEGIRFPQPHELSDGQRRWMRRYFDDEVFPILTPLAVDPAHPFPSLLNKSLNLAVLLLDPREQQLVHRIAVVQVPRVLPRLVSPPRDPGQEGNDYLFLVDLIQDHLASLFPGLSVLHACSFRVTRDSNLDLDEEASTDLVQALEHELDERRRGEPVRLEVSRGAHPDIINRFLDAFDLEPEDVYECAGPVNLARIMELYGKEDRPELKEKPFIPNLVINWETAEGMFGDLRERDILVHHPYDSFSTVERFVHLAAHDPRVLAIKHTIYRAGETSAIVRSLIAAAEQRKQVTVVVELKARFDEEANIRWAKRMERAGIHVVYGIVGLKTHAKATLIVRRDETGMRRYCHLGTGNYNPTTAKIYTDIGLFTANQELAKDVADMFNMITGYAKAPEMQHLVVAPFALRRRTLELIEREIENAKNGLPANIKAKMNSLVDKEVIKALYEASQAGVKIELSIRGICCLRPGVEGLSENITATSVIGRFLEHSRIYYFLNHGNDPELFFASADWMTRNLDRRVEQMVPVLDTQLQAKVFEVLDNSLRDNVKAREFLADGSYAMREPTPDERVFDSQDFMRAQAMQRAGEADEDEDQADDDAA